MHHNGCGLLCQVQWNRAARTDKGVSAAGNVVSLKMMIGHEDIVARINAELPPQVNASPTIPCLPYNACAVATSVTFKCREA